MYLTFEWLDINDIQFNVDIYAHSYKPSILYIVRYTNCYFVCPFTSYDCIVIDIWSNTMYKWLE